LAINEGIAIDAHLVKSASHQLGNERLQEEKLKKQMPEGKIDKNGNNLKFSRVLESDWTVRSFHSSRSVAFAFDSAPPSELHFGGCNSWVGQYCFLWTVLKNTLFCYSGIDPESKHQKYWIPASAGMTK